MDDIINWEEMYIFADKIGLRGYMPKYFKECKYIWDNLVPKCGQADTVQGELLRQIEKLRYEACDNGNINWNDNFDWFCENIYNTFSEAEIFNSEELKIIKETLNFIKENGNYARDYSEGKINDEECDPVKLAYTDDDLYDFLADMAARFYLSKKEPIIYEHKSFIYC